jgi:hypothetical protein
MALTILVRRSSEYGFMLHMIVRSAIRVNGYGVCYRGCLKRVDMGGQESSRYCLVGRPYD